MFIRLDDSDPLINSVTRGEKSGVSLGRVITMPGGIFGWMGVLDQRGVLVAHQVPRLPYTVYYVYVMI